MGLCKLRSKEVIEAFYWEGSQDDEAVVKWIEDVLSWDYAVYSIKDGILKRKTRFSSQTVADLNKEPYLVPYETTDDMKYFNSHSELVMNMSYTLVED